MDKEKIKHYLQIAQALVKDIEEYKSYDARAAFRLTQKKIKAKEGTLRRFTVVRNVAAALLLPMMAVSTVLTCLHLKHSEESVSDITLMSAPGTVTRVCLPDRSEVWLNAGSTLRYPSRFTDEERNVFLEGEACFRVTASATNPFCVHIDRVGMCVKAFGTRFNVSSYAEDSATEVMLESGVVDVVIEGRALSLHPNEMLTIDASRRPTLRRVSPEEKTAWTNGRLLFRNTPLDEVLRKLSRRYNVDIELLGDTSKRYNFRATFTAETISQVLDYMKMAAPMEWVFTAAEQRVDYSYTRQKIRVTLK
ncbi:MAG: DUF4974 domain-containing protein [Tannerellaceae bacterium]|jgi:ferric-dicitrate binding protein FerR (iron transport regulator)|nr:DUF4974 domain-containing protein [Tannerellaceae bacterium]